MLKDIYFYNALALAKELKNDTFSEYRAIKHLIVSFIIGGIGFTIPISAAFQDDDNVGLVETLTHLTSFIITGIISYYGVWLTYQVNCKGDSKDYFLRFVSLSLPIGIQLITVFIAVALILIVLTTALVSSLGAGGAYIYFALYTALMIIFTLMFFSRMRRYMAIATGINE